jgi:type I restriction-modification system DNA methylase subunit
MTAGWGSPGATHDMADPNLSSFIWSVADLLRGDYKQSE